MEQVRVDALLGEVVADGGCPLFGEGKVEGGGSGAVGIASARDDLAGSTGFDVSRDPGESSFRKWCEGGTADSEVTQLIGERVARAPVMRGDLRAGDLGQGK